MQGSISFVNTGDVISLDYTGDPAGHAGIVDSISGGTYNIKNQNAQLSSSAYISAGSLGGNNASMHMNSWAGYTVKAIIHHPNTTSNSSDLHGFIDPSAAINAKATRGFGGWNQEVGPGNASKIAVGGNTMIFLRGDQAEFAKNGQGGAWTQETNASSVSAIAVSSTGIHLIIGTDNAIYSKPGIGFGGWTQEVGPGNASAISLAADNMMFLRGDQAVFGRVGRGGAWIQETNPSAATAIAVGASGLNMMLVVNGEIDTRPGFGWLGWTAETSPSSATAIAASQ